MGDIKKLTGTYLMEQGIGISELDILDGRLALFNV